MLLLLLLSSSAAAAAATTLLLLTEEKAGNNRKTEIALRRVQRTDECALLTATQSDTYTSGQPTFIALGQFFAH